MNRLESLDNSKFAKISSETMRATRGGTVTSGYDYTIRGVTRRCASDCTEMVNGYLYAEFYDSKGALMDSYYWG